MIGQPNENSHFCNPVVLFFCPPVWLQTYSRQYGICNIVKLGQFAEQNQCSRRELSSPIPKLSPLIPKAQMPQPSARNNSPVPGWRPSWSFHPSRNSNKGGACSETYHADLAYHCDLIPGRRRRRAHNTPSETAHDVDFRNGVSGKGPRLVWPAQAGPSRGGCSPDPIHVGRRS